MRYWIEMALFFHLVFSIIEIYDLFEESKLKNKVRFALLICLLPFAGMLMFEAAKRRRRRKRLSLPPGRQSRSRQSEILVRQKKSYST